jgi:TolA-binding protein
LAAVAIAAAPIVVQAQSLSEIRTRARQLEGEWRAQRGSASAESALVEQLGKLVLVFITESDRASQAGSEQQQRGALRAAFDAIYDPLNGIYSSRGERLDAMAKKIMDEDGDLDALYESKEFQEAQSVAGQALYYLNWLNYYGARLHDGQRAKDLLNAAEKGFSQFAVGERHTALIAESLLGRGLCHVELGNTEWAARDFKLVIEHPDASPERRAKARVALADAYARSGNVNQTLEYTRELLGSSSLDRRDHAIVSFIRLQALFKAVKTSPGAEGYRREAGALMDQLRRAGSGWSGKVDALMLTQVDDPAKWAGKVESPTAKWELAKLLLAKGDDKGAQPLLQDVVASTAAEARPFQAEAHYWLGISAFKSGDHVAATDHFTAALADPKATYAADASYWYFKSLEARIAAGTDAALEQQYVAAIRSFLKDHPDHKQAYEVRYRLGEFQQAKEQFADAISSYAQVSGDPGIELRASFGTVQSGFELLKSAPDAAARTTLLQQLGPELDRFDQRANAYAKTVKQGDVPVREFQAKVTILRAVHIALSSQDGSAKIADLLADYATRFPEQRDLLPQAVRLRLDALREVGRFTDAEREMTAHAEALRSEGRVEALEKIATGYQKAAARREADGDAAGAKAATAVAQQLYQVLVTMDGGSNDRSKLVLARLSESTDPARAEAIYKELQQGDKGTALAALRGLARVAEMRQQLPEAGAYWKQYTAATTPGDPPWYEGQYQQARVALARGEREGSCKILTDLRPAMPGLSDATLRQQLADLYKQACE